MLWVLKKNRLNEMVLLGTQNTIKLTDKILILHVKCLLNWTFDGERTNTTTVFLVDKMSLNQGLL